MWLLEVLLSNQEAFWDALGQIPGTIDFCLFLTCSAPSIGETGWAVGSGPGVCFVYCAPGAFSATGVICCTLRVFLSSWIPPVFI